MKATKAGYTIGKALESWTPCNNLAIEQCSNISQIEAFVNLGYYTGTLNADGYLDTDSQFIAKDIKVKLSQKENDRIFLPETTTEIASDSASPRYVDVSIAATLSKLLERIEKL